MSPCCHCCEPLGIKFDVLVLRTFQENYLDLMRRFLKIYFNYINQVLFNDHLMSTMSWFIFNRIMIERYFQKVSILEFIVCWVMRKFTIFFSFPHFNNIINVCYFIWFSKIVPHSVTNALRCGLNIFRFAKLWSLGRDLTCDNIVAKIDEQMVHSLLNWTKGMTTF